MAKGFRRAVDSGGYLADSKKQKQEVTPATRLIIKTPRFFIRAVLIISGTAS
jgi:hypothetical protein